MGATRSDPAPKADKSGERAAETAIGPSWRWTEFWGGIKPKFGKYAERRTYLREEFDPLLAALEAQSTSPGDENASAVLAGFEWTEVQAAWHKALERKTADPEGAITAARTLLESVCKHVLDEAGVPYDPKAGRAAHWTTVQPPKQSAPSAPVGPTRKP